MVEHITLRIAFATWFGFGFDADPLTSDIRNFDRKKENLL